MAQHPHILTNHAISIEATPEDVWRWLTQMGWHLGGWYTPEWVDRLLFPQNWPSLDHLDPALLRALEVGDTIPDGPPGTAECVESGALLTPSGRSPLAASNASIQ